MTKRGCVDGGSRASATARGLAGASKTKGPIAVGIVGLGRAGWGMHVGELAQRKDKFRIVAVCDVQKQRLDHCSRELGCRGYRSIEGLLADPEVELADIASRSPEHVEHAVLGLKARKIVFLEKPIAVNLSQAKRLRAAARGKEDRLFIRHNRRFEGPFERIREIMASGILGNVFEIKLRRNGYQRRDDWQTLIRCGGGQLLNWGPHVIDHALRLLESPRTDTWSDLKRVTAVGDAEDHLKIVMRGENGRIVDLEISGGAALREPEYLIYGSRGALRCSGSDIELRYLDPKVKLAARRARVQSPPLGASFGSKEDLCWIEETVKAEGGPDRIWDRLYAAIRDGVRFPVTLDESIEVMEVIEEVRRGTPFAQ